MGRLPFFFLSLFVYFERENSWRRGREREGKLVLQTPSLQFDMMLLTSGRSPIGLYLQPSASARSISSRAPWTPSLPLSLQVSPVTRRPFTLDALGPEPSSRHLCCVSKTSSSDFFVLLYEIGYCFVSWGGGGGSLGMMNVNMYKWHRAYQEEGSRLLYSFSTHPHPCHSRLNAPIFSCIVTSRKLS